MTKQPDLDTLIGSAVYTLAQTLIAGGMTPNQAVSHVGFAIIEGTLGREASRSLGLPRPTMSRWRRQLAEVAQGAEEIDLDATRIDVINALLPSLGLRDLRIVRGGDTDAG